MGIYPIHPNTRCIKLDQIGSFSQIFGMKIFKHKKNEIPTTKNKFSCSTFHQNEVNVTPSKETTRDHKACQHLTDHRFDRQDMLFFDVSILQIPPKNWWKSRAWMFFWGLMNSWDWFEIFSDLREVWWTLINRMPSSSVVGLTINHACRFEVPGRKKRSFIALITHIWIMWKKKNHSKNI